jgi:thiol-disulfide isomerase/thioredoxin
MDHYLQAERDYEAPDSTPYVEAAGFLVRHKWQPARALELLRKAQPLLAHEQELQARDDNQSADRQEMDARQTLYQHQQFNSFLLQAAQQAGRPDEAKAVRASVEGPPPTDKSQESTYWLNRGRLAVIEDRKADALTYYHLAFAGSHPVEPSPLPGAESRPSPPVPRHGRVYDPLNEEARALWEDLGGSEVAWNLWLKSKPNGQELVDGRWEKATKPLPAFELADLAGKTWKLKNLEGKTLLINVWATWCPPCNAELPHLQKLYEAMKDRSDVQILTFNVDETLGLVQPFVAKKGYTFPVLPAYSLVENILDGVAIPQNWVVDPKGSWRWTQLGFDGAPNWAKVVTDHVESVRAAAP